MIKIFVYILASAVQEALENQHGHENVTLQQGGPTVYSTQVQYVDDPSLYSTNGQMYEYYRCGSAVFFVVAFHLFCTVAHRLFGLHVLKKKSIKTVKQN